MSHMFWTTVTVLCVLRLAATVVLALALRKQHAHARALTDEHHTAIASK